jgi:hypothetical protein
MAYYKKTDDVSVIEGAWGAREMETSVLELQRHRENWRRAGK